MSTIVHSQLVYGVILGCCVTIFLMILGQFGGLDTMGQQFTLAAVKTNINLTGASRGDERLNSIRPLASSHKPGEDGYAKVIPGHNLMVDDSVAQGLYKKVRVLCLIITYPTNLYTKAIHVRDTWTRRCNVALFMSSKEDTEFPAIGLNVSEGRAHLMAKTAHSFSYAYHHHLNDADWFLKADDDTYVIMENLRYFLSNENSSLPVMFGERLDDRQKPGQRFCQGGAGYVLSKEILKRYIAKRNKHSSACRQDGAQEDQKMSNCVRALGGRLKPSVDSLGKSRFHRRQPDTLMTFKSKVPRKYKSLDNPREGPEHTSDYTISFHHVPNVTMRTLDFMTYHLQAYGIIRGLQDLNVHP